MLIATAVAIDNFSEALSIGALIRREGAAAGRVAARVLGWTGLIGAVVFGSALLGWLALRDIPEAVLALLLAVGAGGMFYLTVTDLVPQAEEYHYEQSGAIASAVGFVLMFTLVQMM